MTSPGGSRDLVLTGPMGAGKTSAGRELARLLGRPFDDLDALVRVREGRTVSELFAESEGVFRAAERRAAETWLDGTHADAPRVLALGGGALADEGLASALSDAATLVHLDAAPEQLALRLGAAARRERPLLAGSADPAASLARLRRQRAPGYARAALTVDTSGDDARTVAVAVLRALHDPRGGPWRAAPRPLAPGSRTGEGATIGRGAFPATEADTVVVVWDGGVPAVHERAVAPLAASAARRRYVPLELEGGERSKSVEALSDLWRRLLAARVETDVPVHAVGGGAVCDVVALAAHTYKRGVPLTLHPTTLLAQLDAALGGKTAINLAGVKNAVGTIRLPGAVHVDSLFLPTLAPADLGAGLAEAVKAAVVGDAELFVAMERDAASLASGALPSLERVVERAAAVKLRVVDEDLDDAGARLRLNLGHTLGHALEAATAESARPLGHGAAVAIGLSFAARLARRVGALEEAELPERVDALLAALSLPSRLPELAPRAASLLRDALAQDKKRRGGRAVWALPRARGRVETDAVAAEDVEAELEASP